MIKLNNDISSCFANIGSGHDTLLQQFCVGFDGTITWVCFRIWWDVEPDTDQLVVADFYSIGFWKLQLNFVSIVAR